MIVHKSLQATEAAAKLIFEGMKNVAALLLPFAKQDMKDEWVRVPDTHEAIIPHETFDKVQALLVRDTRTSPKGREVHLFSGFLKCADCGKSITRSQSGKNIYYACSTYKNHSRTAYSMHSIKHNRLEAAVRFAIQYQVNTAVSYSELIARINSAPLKKVNPTALTTRLPQRKRN